MFGEAIDAPRDEANAAQPIDHALKHRRIANDVLAFRSS